MNIKYTDVMGRKCEESVKNFVQSNMPSRRFDNDREIFQLRRAFARLCDRLADKGALDEEDIFKIVFGENS